MIIDEDAVQGEGQRAQGLFASLRRQLTFPHRDAVPSHLRQPLLRLLVALPVPHDLLHPESPVC